MTLFVSGETRSVEHDSEVAGRTVAEGIQVTETQVQVRTLDDILVQAGMESHSIHFCKVDVEGAEADVLAGFDLAKWRPWVLVVEATVPQSTAPSHGDWETEVLAAGYTRAFFMGLIATTSPTNTPNSVLGYPTRLCLRHALYTR